MFTISSDGGRNSQREQKAWAKACISLFILPLNFPGCLMQTSTQTHTAWYHRGRREKGDGRWRKASLSVLGMGTSVLLTELCQKSEPDAQEALESVRLCVCVKGEERKW